MSETEEMLDLSKEIAKEIAKDVYADGGKPVVKPTGELVALVPRAIKAAFAPLEKWILQREYNVAETQKLLEEKLKYISPELIQPPDAYIAVPVIQYISYCMDNDKLRNMYANLLAASMRSDKKWAVHPSFVEIIRQICPDEAKILQYIVTHCYDEIPVIDLIFTNESNEGISILKHFSNLGELAKCDYPLNICKYFDNLVRLGLVEHGPFLSRLIGDHLYEPLKNHEYILEKSKEASFRDDGYNTAIVNELYMYMTDYGKSFCEVCLVSENRNIIE